MAGFVGKWEQTSRSNVEKLIALMGIPEDKKQRAIDNMNTMALEISREGSTVNMKMIMPHSTRDMSLKPNEDCDYYTSSGMLLKTRGIEMTDTRMVQILKDKEGKMELGSLTSEVNGDELTAVMKIKDEESVSKFKRV